MENRKPMSHTAKAGATKLFTSYGVKGDLFTLLFKFVEKYQMVKELWSVHDCLCMDRWLNRSMDNAISYVHILFFKIGIKILMVRAPNLYR